jgi:CDP-paratose 2-epimerase
VTLYEPDFLSDGPVLITGGAGFIGSNLAHCLLERGIETVVFDDLSRAGATQNLEWLRAEHGGRLRMVRGDIRDRDSVRRVVREARFVFHFAAQVAVTTSLTDPMRDFQINAGGTLTLLEELRRLENPPGLLFTSTNKVYGALPDIGLHAHWNRYEPDDPVLARSGVGESRPLDFHSPYGCSKGAADQYVLDYARTYRIPAVVFRMSCIYGPRQFGNEDQGWLAHFLIRAIEQAPITIYGDGKQVRDVLFIDDLVNAFLLARQNIGTLSGKAFNIGGGPANTLSLVELIRIIRSYCEYSPEIYYADWRQGDQRYYVSDCSSFCAATGWTPRVNVQDGVACLYGWLFDNHEAPAVPALARETV